MMPSEHLIEVMRPLVIASSGGGGHIAAAKGIVDELKTRDNTDIMSHKATLYHSRLSNPIRSVLRGILYATRFKFIGNAWEWIHEQMIGSNVLDYDSFWKEIGYLQDGSLRTPQRPYVDLLLDTYSFGYEMAAIFNALQRRDKTHALLETVSKQAIADNIHYQFIKSRIIGLLKTQAETGRPYTTIISTQPQSLGALCDAVAWYNESYLVSHNQTRLTIRNQINALDEKISDLHSKLLVPPATMFDWLNLIWINYVVLFFAKREWNALQKATLQQGDNELKPIRIEQYMTDLPTSGAIHFSSALEKLTPSQRASIDLYCLGQPHQELENKLQGMTIIQLSTDNNPMLRAAFRDTASLESFASDEHDCVLTFKQDEELCARNIPARAAVASVMLGSLGGDASASYILPLLQKGYTHIFLFGAKGNESIHHVIAGLTESQKQCLVCLGNQDDKIIAPIMTRSHCVITRSGGLSAMEQMALPVIEKKQVLIHHKDPELGSTALTSGLPWEDGNADCMIAHLEGRGARVKKTSPSHVSEDLEHHGIEPAIVSGGIKHVFHHRGLFFNSNDNNIRSRSPNSVTVALSTSSSLDEMNDGLFSVHTP